MKLYRTQRGPVVEIRGEYRLLDAADWDAVVSRDDLPAWLADQAAGATPIDGPIGPLLPPVGSQEVWAAGVTYRRSREARMEESKDAGGGSFYDRVYSAERPELFFKSAGHRAVGPGGAIRCRRDSKWNVPEPELTLLCSPGGRITGYTVGNDMSSRDIEGENPLYLPQAKVYDGACALGPCVLVADHPLPAATPIELRIERGGRSVFEGATSLAQIKRELPSLVEYLYREMSFPAGCYLMTGTGVVPPDDFTLAAGDEVTITIPPIGSLTNVVA